MAKDADAASLAAAIVLVEEGRADELWAAITGPLEDGTPEEQAALRGRVLTHYLGSAIGCYLVAERGHSWTVSWSGPLGLVDGKGNVKGPFAMAASLLADPSSGGRLRRSLGGVARLREFRASVAEGLEPEPPGEEVVTLLVDVGARRRRWDAVVTTSSVVLHPIARGLGWALKVTIAHLHGISGPAAAATRKRVEKLQAMSTEELFGGAAGAAVLPIDEVVRVRKRRGPSLEIELAGQVKPWRLGFRTKEDRDTMLATLQELMAARLASPQHLVAA